MFVFVRRFPSLERRKHCEVLRRGCNVILSRPWENLRGSRWENKRQFKWFTKGSKIKWKLLRFEFKSHSLGSWCLREFGSQWSSYYHSQPPKRWLFATNFSLVCLQFLPNSGYRNFSATNYLLGQGKMGILIILDKLHFEVQYILYSTVTIFLKLKVTWATFSTQINKYVVFHLPRYFQRKNIEVAQNLFINLRNDTAADATISDTLKTQQVRLTNLCDDNLVEYSVVSKTWSSNFWINMKI